MNFVDEQEVRITGPVMSRSAARWRGLLNPERGGRKHFHGDQQGVVPPHPPWIGTAWNAS